MIFIYIDIHYHIMIMKFIHYINFTNYIKKENVSTVTDMLQNDCILMYKSCVNATTFCGI